MLMAGGIDKYFQICRCFRDEDFRLDRQPEFTQIDMEMAFADEDDLHKVIEGLMKKVVKNCIGIEIETPFSVISYEESMVTYGTDKPDLRFDLPIKTLSQMFLNEDYKAFYIADSERKTIAAINISKDIATYSRKQSDQLLEQCKIEGVVFYFVKNKEDGIGLNFLTPEDKKLISDELSSKSGDSIVFAIGSGYQVYESLGRVRSVVGKEILNNNEELKNSFKFTWVNKFPLFLWSEDKNSLDSAQHPFTLPKMDQYIKNIDTAPLDIESCSSDLVLNGFELGSGGIRIVNAEFQKQIFEKVGVASKDIDEQFDYLFDALSSGAPPEAGFALGVDRIAMLLTRSASLRDVIAFPKNTRGASPLTKEPSEITKEQHKEVFGE
jgi:aspartyl-tRNA synthetase